MMAARACRVRCLFRTAYCKCGYTLLLSQALFACMCVTTCTSPAMFPHSRLVSGGTQGPSPRFATKSSAGTPIVSVVGASKSSTPTHSSVSSPSMVSAPSSVCSLSTAPSSSKAKKISPTSAAESLATYSSSLSSSVSSTSKGRHSSAQSVGASSTASTVSKASHQSANSSSKSVRRLSAVISKTLAAR
jgi:hypothetical protein